MKNLTKKAASLAALAFGAVVVYTVPAGAQISKGALDAKGTGTADNIDPTGSDGIVNQVVNFILWAVGIIAVVMLIWGGIRYMTSGGDSNKLTSAKNTIIYAVIGLIVAIFAYAIVAFVNGTFGTP